MKRKITTYGGYFERFLATLSSKEVIKLNYIISLLETEERMPVKFIKLFNGFQKKSQKTPTGEIEKALKIKEAYYGDKQS